MKILYYNWIQFDNAEHQGGGVNVYQYNLIDAMKDDPDIELYFLSSGQKINPFHNGAYCVETANCFGEKCRSFELINSPVLASAMVHVNPRSYMDDEKSEKMLSCFIDGYGPFDIIHFQNIEGLSSNVFRLKKAYPQTKFIYSVHNYFAVCTTGNLFHKNRRERCLNCHAGNDCIGCEHVYDATVFYTDALMRFFFGHVGQSLPMRCLRRFIRFFAPIINRRYGGSQTMIGENYISLRRHNIDLINGYVDISLAVSERVRQIMIDYGVRPNKIITSYIGTKVADSPIGHSVAEIGDLFTIAYLGYARADKGYFFLMNALAGLSSETKSKLRIVLAVKGLDQDQVRKQLSGFGNIQFYDGYSHNDLPRILSRVNLGIVPVIWEDNLPQVAIEMVAHGVPILCSSFGGASELCEGARFRFVGGDVADFTRTLCQFVDSPSLVKEYWSGHKGLTTMAEHIRELKQLYK